MDVQFVLDPYACAVYILSYITKGQRGISKVLDKASKEANSGNKDILNRVRYIGNAFLNAAEISAQEAVYLLLQMPLRRSREFQFINTSNPDEMTFLLKSHDKIKELPDKSIDVESDNVLKRYGRRPKQLIDVCLADFIACFNGIRDKDSSFDISNLQDGYFPESDFHENTDDDPHSSDEHLEPSVEYQMKSGFQIVKRRKSRIVRSIRFHKDKDPENYYREQLMLYYPWRNERKDLLGSSLSYQERYKQVKYIVNKNKKYY